MNTLVIAAHPDDEILGCGGAIARLAREGKDVHILILGEGITSRNNAPDLDEDSEIEALHANAQKAGEILGAASVRVLDFPDNRFDTVPLLDLTKMIETVIHDIGPEVVYTQHGGDLNIDHVHVYRATLTATRPMIHCPVKRLFAYEVASSSEWAFQKFAPVFHPNVFVDITETLEAKINAMQAYESEARPFPHPRSPEALRAMAKHWGSVAGLEAAEAFELVRSIQ